MTDGTPTAPDSPVERALVSRGWADIDLVERLGTGASGRHRTARLTADHERARSWYRRPVHDHVSASRMASYESEANLVRYRRVVDFLTPGERVYEVGLGLGILAVMMLREGRLSYYHGVDLSTTYADYTRKMLRANELAESAGIATKDLYDLTRADIADVGAGLLVCCEVIEHVPDPELALTTLARALPEGTDLLFSVPLVGRLETLWGHGQVFGAARLHRMLQAAGLVAHHVEVLHDTWALVLASGGTAPSPRAAAALGSSAQLDPADLLTPKFVEMANQPVTGLARAESRWTKRVGDPSVTPCESKPQVERSPMEGLHVTARSERITSGPGKGWSASAGVAFAVPEGTKGVRLEFHLAEPGDLAAVHVEFRRDGERTGLWKWKPAEKPMRATHPTFLIAPGRDGVHLRRVPGATSEGADTVEVFALAREDQPIDFSILRWAWVR